MYGTARCLRNSDLCSMLQLCNCERKNLAAGRGVLSCEHSLRPSGYARHTHLPDGQMWPMGTPMQSWHHGNTCLDSPCHLHFECSFLPHTACSYLQSFRRCQSDAATVRGVRQHCSRVLAGHNLRCPGITQRMLTLKVGSCSWRPPAPSWWGWWCCAG